MSGGSRLSELDRNRAGDRWIPVPLPPPAVQKSADPSHYIAMMSFRPPTSAPNFCDEKISPSLSVQEAISLSVCERNRMMWTRTFAAVFAALLGITAAFAEGSVGFDEVMQFAAQNRKLAREIKNSIREQRLRQTDIQCAAARFGNQWTYLGGDRAPPFTCHIGNRVLTINGEIDFFDAAGRKIKGGLDNPDVFRKARSFKGKKPAWSWQKALGL